MNETEHGILTGDNFPDNQSSTSQENCNDKEEHIKDQNDQKRQDLTSLLECSVCLKTFDDPRTLHCLHSFCKKCLENFVEGKREDELNCPVCHCKFTLDKEGKNTTFNLKRLSHTVVIDRASTSIC